MPLSLFTHISCVTLIQAFQMKATFHFSYETNALHVIWLFSFSSQFLFFSQPFKSAHETRKLWASHNSQYSSERQSFSGHRGKINSEISWFWPLKATFPLLADIKDRKWPLTTIVSRLFAQVSWQLERQKSRPIADSEKVNASVFPVTGLNFLPSTHWRP